MDPIRIYCLWHPNCTQGPELAAGIYRWFRGNPKDLAEIGHGIPVFYRSAPAGPGASTPLPIDPAQARINVLVPLVDEHMVVDNHWRGYLRRQMAPGTTFTIPVALHDAAFHLPSEISRRNFLRVDRVTDPATWGREERQGVRRQRLLSLLTQTISRLLSAGADAGADAGPAAAGQAPPHGGDWQDRPAAPITVFISHAKADGVPIAEALRHAILTQGQLQAFFDESELAIGYGFADTLERGAGAGESAARGGTAAMLAVYTDAYANRPWCRRELALARTPTPIGGQPDAPCWRAKPLLIVAALEHGNTRFLPEAGFAPLVTWRPADASTIVDRLLRELVLSAYNEERARMLPPGAGRYALNCLPDLRMLMHMVRQAPGMTELLVPPPGLADQDRQALEALAGGQVRIRTFNEIEA